MATVLDSLQQRESSCSLMEQNREGSGVGFGLSQGPLLTSLPPGSAPQTLM